MIPINEDEEDTKAFLTEMPEFSGGTKISPVVLVSGPKRKKKVANLHHGQPVTGLAASERNS